MAGVLGVFDSGIGGLSVLRAIRKRMPQADIVYFGDTEHVPYGEKSAREIAELIGMALQRLHAAGATDIVSACNSASVSVHTVPIDLLRVGVFNVVEMVGPTVEALAKTRKNIVLCATNATARSNIYQQAFADRGMRVDVVAIPELAGLIEKGATADEMRHVIRPVMQDVIARGADIVSLSCTHYPFVKELFERSLIEQGSKAEVFDPAEAVAEEVEKRFSDRGSGILRFLLSKESPVFDAYVERLFGDTRYTIEEAGSIYWALKSL
jgi:glutamate racemase